MALKQTSGSATLSPSLPREPYITNSTPSIAQDDFDDMDFEDAEQDLGYVVDLQTSFEHCDLAIKKFFNNDIEGALNIMKPWGQSSLYHSLGNSIFEFIPAMLTFDHEQINRAISALKTCIAICNKQRRNYTLVETLGTMIKKPNYSLYTDVEAHAELCYAEAMLLQAAMTIMEGEDLTGLIKGALKVKSCYNTYKECAKILEKKSWQCEESRVNFQSGVRLGMATFNLMISLLPPRIIGLLEFVGFTGNKELGLIELEAGSNSPGLRSVLCDLTLLAYHLVICHYIGDRGDMKLCTKILEKELKVYPEGVWFLFFQGRHEFMRGNFEQAIVTYNRAIDSQDMWEQFRHVCYWELMWVNGLKMSWRESAMFANKLIEESSWSRTIYSYTKAAMLLQLGDKITAVERLQCSELMRNASVYKQRIAGKSLPMEKFVIRRCIRFEAQGRRLVLPALEILCLWNLFGVLEFNTTIAHNVLRLIESTLERHEKCKQPWQAGYESDNLALLRYLQGCCLAALNAPLIAITVLESVLQLKGSIREDTFLLPYSLAEIATCHFKLGKRDRALQALQEARKNYSGYSLESRLHFRMHTKKQLFKGVSS